MTTKADIWLIEYPKCGFNATEAARRAGYSKPNVSGPRNKTKFAAEIKAMLDEKVMSAEEALIRLAEHGRADIGPYLDDTGQVDIVAMKKGDATRLIKEIHTTKRTTIKKDEETIVESTTLKLHDAQAAIVHIGRHHALFTDRKDVSGQIEHEHGSIDEWRAERERRIKETAVAVELLENVDAAN